MPSNKNYKSNSSKIWPKYINDLKKENNTINNINKVDNSGEEFKDNQDMSKTNKKFVNQNKRLDKKIKNLKSDFRKSAKNYYLDQKNNLFYKKTIKYKNKENKFITKIENFFVPTCEQLNQLLYKYHTSSCDANYKILKAIFYKNKIGYLGLDALLQDYIKNFPICVQKGKSEHRLDPIHPIAVPGPDIRNQFDISYLNEDMQKAFGVKYILSVIDVFSRKAMIYPLKKKTLKLY